MCVEGIHIDVEVFLLYKVFSVERMVSIWKVRSGLLDILVQFCVTEAQARRKRRVLYEI